MSDVLEEHEGTVSIAGGTITNLRFAYDIDGLAGSEQKLAQLVEGIDQTSKVYGMEMKDTGRSYRAKTTSQKWRFELCDG